MISVRKRISVKACCLWLFSALLLNLVAFSPASAYYWVGESGLWRDPNNWSLTPGGPGGAGIPGVFTPPYTSDAYEASIITSDPIDRIIDAEGGASPFIVRVDATGLGTTTLLLPNGLGSGPIYIGQNTSNMNIIVNQSGGTLNGDEYEIMINKTLYNLRDGGIYVDGAIFISNSTFNQDSGGVSGYNLVRITNTTYNLKGGSIVTGGLNLIDIKGGLFNQTGGVVGGDYSSVSTSGVYNLSGTGSKVQGDGVGISGTFNQKGGEVTGMVFINVSGTYNLESGSLAGSSLDIGGTFNQKGGEVRGGFSRVLNKISGTYNLESGSLIVTGDEFPDTGLENTGKFNYKGGSLSLLNGTAFYNDGTATLTGTGTRVLDGSVVNNGTWNVTNIAAQYNGVFTNNAAYISNAGTQNFTDLLVGENGYLVGGSADRWFISGDFTSNSVRASDWNTSKSYLAFVGGADLNHDFLITGSDSGASLSGYTNNFAWGTLDVTGNSLYLFDGNAIPGGALYVDEMLGLAISGNQILNIFGQADVNIYYQADLPQNSYLGGLAYHFQGRGRLIPCFPPAVVCRVGGASFTTIQAAYNAARHGDMIQCRETVFDEDVAVNRDISVTLDGGYNADFSSNAGRRTTLKGMITTMKGKITVANFTLEK